MNIFKSKAAAIALAFVMVPIIAFAQNFIMPGTVAYQGGTANESASYTSTLNNKSGQITINPLIVVPNGTYVETITNSAVTATDNCFASLKTTTGRAYVSSIAPAAGSLAITITSTLATSGVATLSFVCYQ